jgi:hypothetical protein
MKEAQDSQLTIWFNTHARSLRVARCLGCVLHVYQHLAKATLAAALQWSRTSSKRGVGAFTSRAGSVVGVRGRDFG